MASMKAFRGVNRRLLPGKAAVAADMIWHLQLTQTRYSLRYVVVKVKGCNLIASIFVNRQHFCYSIT